jgi:hypothetical protein
MKRITLPVSMLMTTITDIAAIANDNMWELNMFYYSFHNHGCRDFGFMYVICLPTAFFMTIIFTIIFPVGKHWGRALP